LVSGLSDTTLLLTVLFALAARFFSSSLDFLATLSAFGVTVFFSAGLALAFWSDAMRVNKAPPCLAADTATLLPKVVLEVSPSKALR
jgi:hypothetical protein